jgi:hypothetical protein
MFGVEVISPGRGGEKLAQRLRAGLTSFALAGLVLPSSERYFPFLK